MNNISVIGSGTMGNGIAQVFASDLGQGPAAGTGPQIGDGGVQPRFYARVSQRFRRPGANSVPL